MRAQIVTKAIILSRRDYQEADRILSVLTPDHGRMSVIAKGVRRSKSKLAGGVELFTVNDLTILPTKSELKTLVSSRMDHNFGNIVKDVQATMLGYELLKRLNRYMEDEAGPEYFELLRQTLSGLDDRQLPTNRVELWFMIQLLSITGHSPNLHADTEGAALKPDETYIFDFESMAFRQHTSGQYGANHIKLMRIASACDTPVTLGQITDGGAYVAEILALVKNILQQHITNA